MIITDRRGQYVQSGRAWYTRNTNTVTKITVHHSAIPKNNYNDDELLAYIKKIHVDQGWPGLAYHYVYNPKTRNVFWINDPAQVTWHDSVNWNSIGVLINGYYHQPHNDGVTREILVDMKDILDHLCTEHPEFPAAHGDVYGHREVGSTACPGDLLIPYVQEYRVKKGDVDWTGGSVSVPPSSGTMTIETALYERLVGRATVAKEVASLMGIDNPDNAPTEAYQKVLSGKDGYINQLQREKGDLEIKLHNKTEEVGRKEEQLLKSAQFIEELQDNLKEAYDLPNKLRRELEGARQALIDLDNKWGKRYGLLEIEKKDIEVRLIACHNKQSFTVRELINLLYDAILSRRF